MQFVRISIVIRKNVPVVVLWLSPKKNVRKDSDKAFVIAL